MTSLLPSTLVNGDSLDGPLFAELNGKEPAEQVNGSATLFRWMLTMCFGCIAGALEQPARSRAPNQGGGRKSFEYGYGGA